MLFEANVRGWLSFESEVDCQLEESLRGARGLISMVGRLGPVHLGEDLVSSLHA